MSFSMGAVPAPLLPFSIGFRPMLLKGGPSFLECGGVHRLARAGSEEQCRLLRRHLVVSAFITFRATHNVEFHCYFGLHISFPPSRWHWHLHLPSFTQCNTNTSVFALIAAINSLGGGIFLNPLNALDRVFSARSLTITERNGREEE